MKLSIKEKLLFIASFLWMLHWGTNIANLIIDTFLLRNGVKKSGKRKGQVLVYNRTEGLNRQQRRS